VLREVMSQSHNVTRSESYKVRKLQGAKDLFLCFLSAILLILSFPGFNLEFLAWFSFVPLFFALKNKSKIKAFIFAYFAGLIFWSGLIYWLVHVTLLGTILLILYLALYFGIFGLVLSMSYELRATSLFFIPSAWIILEYLRSHLLTGFPWALLGYSQYLNLPIIQIADITGAWGVSFLVMMVNVLLYRLICCKVTMSPACPVGRQRHKSEILNLIVVFSLWLSVFGYGLFRLRPGTAGPEAKSIKVAIVQGNISREIEWQANTKDFILKKYLALSRHAAKEAADLMIWPEAAVPGILKDGSVDFSELGRLIQETRIPLLTGAVTLRDNAYYNSAILLDTDAGLIGRYDKLHLVPFGEYIPLKKILPFLETIVPIGDISPGRDLTVFRAYLSNGPGHGLAINFSVLICFEDLFPELSREFVKRGASFLVNITNDAWYKKTAASYQHAQAAVFRAVENRVFLVRSANTGISAFISPSGKITSPVEDQGEKIFIDGYKTRELRIPKSSKETLYTLWGDWFVVLSFILLWFFSGIGDRFCPLCRAFLNLHKRR
jgi:apolipoprotein N-acyltransferase